MNKIKRLILVFSIVTPILFLFQNCGEGLDSSDEASLALLSDDPLSKVPPTVNITTKLNKYIPISVVNIEFNGNDAFQNIITNFECAVNGETFFKCTSPLKLSALEEGDYVLEVKAVDLFKNATVESITWVVDYTPPRVLINNPPTLTGSRNLNIKFDSSDNISGIKTLNCKLNNNVIRPCTSPLNFVDLEEGQYNLSIMAEDKAGHAFMSNTVNWQISRAAPTLNLTASPAANTKSRNAQFTMNANGPDGVRDYRCRINGGEFAVCAKSVSYSNLPEGNNFFEFRIVNNLGIVSQIHRYNWKIDTVQPNLSFTSTPASRTLANFANFTFNATDSGSTIGSILCSLDGGTFAACSTPYNLSSLSVGSHTLIVRAIDKATNQRQISYSWTRNAEANCIGVGPCITSPKALVSNQSGQKLYSISAGSKSIVEIDLATGNRRTVSSTNIGRGPALNDPRDLIISSDDLRLYLVDAGLDALVVINIANGNRRIISNASIGVGPNFVNPIALVYNPSTQHALVLDNSSNRKLIIQVDLENGERTNISGSNVGTGDQLSNPRDMVLNANSNALFIIDTAYNGLRRVDLANNGNRSYYAPTGTTGINISNSMRLERNTSGDRYYISLNQTSNTIVEINMTNGQRRRVSNLNSIFYQENAITGMSVNPNTTKLHVLGSSTRNFTEVDIANGTTRTLFPINRTSTNVFDNNQNR